MSAGRTLSRQTKEPSGSRQNTQGGGSKRWNRVNDSTSRSFLRRRLMPASLVWKVGSIPAGPSCGRFLRLLGASGGGTPPGVRLTAARPAAFRRPQAVARCPQHSRLPGKFPTPQGPGRGGAGAWRCWGRAAPPLLGGGGGLHCLPSVVGRPLAVRWGVACLFGFRSTDFAVLSRPCLVAPS